MYQTVRQKKMARGEIYVCVRACVLLELDVLY